MELSERVVVAGLAAAVLAAGCEIRVGTGPGNQRNQAERTTKAAAGRCCTKLHELQKRLQAGEWSSVIQFVDPKSEADVEMQVYVSPGSTPCVSRAQKSEEHALSVPIPPSAPVSDCGDPKDKGKWFSNPNGVGNLQIRPGSGKPSLRRTVTHRHVSGETRVLTYTFVLPESYRWKSWKVEQAVDLAGGKVPVTWKKWHDRVLSVQAERVHQIKMNLAFDLEPNPLAAELRKRYRDCPDCVQTTARGVRLRLPAQVLFPSGSAELTGRGRKILEKLLPVVRRHVQSGHRLEVVGHTDAQPIRTARYPSNWELSTARACSVVRYFVAKGVPAEAFVAMGRAGVQPLADNGTEEGRRRNRRVELFFQTKGASPQGLARNPTKTGK